MYQSTSVAGSAAGRDLARHRVAGRCRGIGIDACSVLTPNLKDDPTGREFVYPPCIAGRAGRGYEGSHVMLLRRIRDAVVGTRRPLVVPVARQIQGEGRCPRGLRGNTVRESVSDTRRPRQTGDRPRAGSLSTANLKDDPARWEFVNTASVAGRAGGRYERPHVMLLVRVRNAVVGACRAFVVPVAR